MVDDDSSVRIFDVVQSALGKTAIFLERIMLWNSAQFINAAGWTPATAIDSMFQGDVERGAIAARLPAGNNFHNENRQAPIPTGGNISRFRANGLKFVSRS